MEFDFPFRLSPEQKSILLLWFGSDSKFGWTKLDFLLGVHRVRRLYPDHRHNLYKGDDEFTCGPSADFDYDNYGNPIIRFHDGDDYDDSIPF